MQDGLLRVVLAAAPWVGHDEVLGRRGSVACLTLPGELAFRMVARYSRRTHPRRHPRSRFLIHCLHAVLVPIVIYDFLRGRFLILSLQYISEFFEMVPVARSHERWLPLRRALDLGTLLVDLRGIGTRHSNAPIQ